ncbi:MAG: DUF4962 domain-containing protein [Lentisphaeraceae bacterium]|nr:DUF4962 domain-containing protein [Lentisphaeraceae bacterium]
MKQRKIFIILALIFAVTNLLIAENNYKKIGSEYRITSKAIYEKYLDKAIPAGGKPVDRNPPYLAYNPWIEEMDGILKTLTHLNNTKRRQAVRKIKASREYIFQLSQDKNFKRKVIQSEKVGWSFWNPFRKLDKGTWYWRVTHKFSSSSKALFRGPVHSFVITGDEYVFVPPSTAKMVNTIKNMGSPRTAYKKEMLEKLRLSFSPAMRTELVKQANKVKTKEVDSYNDLFARTKEKKEKYGKENVAVKAAFNTVTKHIIDNCSAIKYLVNTYIITGEKQYKKYAIDLLKKVYQAHSVYKGKHIWSPSTFHGNNMIRAILQVLDVFGEELEPAFCDELVQRCIYGILSGSDNFNVQVARSEYVIYDSHLWQISVRNSLRTAITLMPYTPQAEKWFKYFYNLWLFRAPAGSRTDGGWNADFSYFDVNKKTLTQVPWILTQISDFNFFDVPWYKNFAKYLTFAETKGNPKTTFGDRKATESIGRGDYLKTLSEFALLSDPDNYWNRWRMYNMPTAIRNPKKTEEKKTKNFNEEGWYLAQARLRYGTPKLRPPKAPTKHMYAALFPDLGFVGAFSDMLNPANNMMVQFRSSTFGSPNHALPAQNAFNLAYGGKSLFISTGHRQSSKIHNKFDFDNSRAHNTIVPDGLTQSSETDGFGWVPRFAHGEKYTYFVGDASSAYCNSRKPSADGTKEVAVTTTVNRFRRHMLILRPNILIIYDELGAKDPYEWRLKLHSLRKITKHKGGIHAFNEHADVNVHFWGSDKLKINVTDQYMFPAVDVRGKKVKGKQPLYPNAWHATTAPVKKYKKFRFLTIMQIQPKSGELKVMHPKRLSKNRFQVADYQISCQLNAAKPSYFKVMKKDRTFALVSAADVKQLVVGKKKLSAKIKGTTLFFEKTKDKDYIYKLEDTLPNAVNYWNLYW